MFDGKRRQFITLLGGAAVAWPLAARGQQPMIGLLSGSSPGAIPHLLAAFDRGLADNGFINGRDVAPAILMTRISAIQPK